ncbi:MAG: hypothetical protein HY074_16225, partial [Deltaproteobacteria bacterium]|nr:hypothetical protein [Deltaproteobacteria bacterium]
MQPKGTDPALSIRLSPQGQATTFELPFSLLSTPQALSDLGCFFVNARSDLIPSQKICTTVDSGVVSLPVNGIGTPIPILVPLGKSLTFEAYGLPGACSDSSDPLKSAAGNGGVAFFLGTAVTGDVTPTTVVVPAAFNANAAVSCGGPVVPAPLEFGTGVDGNF